MVNVKNNMTSEEVNDLIKKYEYLVKANLKKHFFVYANKNDCYFDILQAGLIGLWYGIKNYKDRDFNNEYSFKCYLSRCAYTKMSDFTKLHKHKKEDCKSLIDVVNIDMEGNKLTIEDLYETFDDTTDVIASEIIDFYTGIYKEIMILLSKGYKLREVSRELGISYSKLNNVYMPEIRENLNIRYGIKRSTPYYCDKKIKDLLIKINKFLCFHILLYI